MTPARPLALALRLGLGGLMAWAGLMKLRDPGEFANEIANYHLFPSLAPWLAVTLPAIEIVLGLALCAAPRAWLRAAALATAGLLAVFTVAVAQVVARGINVSCGCFGGTGSGPVTGLTIARDLVLLAAAIALLLLASRPPRPLPAR
jgi:putative oxidoreductase